MIIDAHVHFYDPGRPQGVPWPAPVDRRLYRSRLPADYRSSAPAEGVDGVIVIEASPWLDDNQWILDLAVENPLIVGVIGNLPVGTPEFAIGLKRFAANPLFRGIRIRAATLAAGLSERDFLSDLQRLADHALSLDLYGPPDLLYEVVRLAAFVPRLPIVIDHVANVEAAGGVLRDEWLAAMNRAGSFEQVFCKISGLVEKTGRHGSTAQTIERAYSPLLDAAWDAFGADRMIYGSNWPVSGQFATLDAVQRIVADYFADRGPEAEAKIFAENAKVAYRLSRATIASNRG